MNLQKRVFVPLVLASLVVGCSSTATTAPPSAPQTAATSASATGAASSVAAPSAQASIGKQTIGIVDFSETSSTSHQFSLEDQKAITAAGWDNVMLDPNGDVTKANTICQQFVTRQVNAIIIDVFTPDEMAQCLTAAKTAGIPVFGNSISLAPGITGGAINTFTAQALNERFIADAAKDGITDIMTINYHAGAPCLGRTNGLLPLLVQHPEITHTDYEVTFPNEVQLGQQVTTAWLAAHPPTAGHKLGIWSCFSEPVLGALAAIKQLGRTDVIPEWTWDVTQATVAPIKSGQIAANLWLDPAGMAVQMMAQLNGYFASPTTWTPKEDNAAYKIIDASNIDAWMAANPSAVQP